MRTRLALAPSLALGLALLAGIGELLALQAWRLRDRARRLGAHQGHS